jgi:lipoteichoic acid synthase
VVTPTLYKLTQGGVVLNNFYNSFKNTTTNGEYAFMTGLWPDVSRVANANSSSGSFVQSKNKYFPFALGNMFEKLGIKTYAYHNFRGYYYQRNKTHPNLGYTSVRFMGGTNGMKFTSEWPSSDYEMMQQSIDDYVNNEQFHAYYMTFSGHGPYSSANPICRRNLQTVKGLLGDRDLTLGAQNYLAANYELEKAMTYLLEKLEAAGKIDNTLIVLVGDHYPYYLPDASFNSLAGKEVEANFEKYKSTCIMWSSGFDKIEVNAPCSNVDILPTVLNLFGMEYDSRLLPGVDVFSDNTHIAMLYNKSFITDKVKYNAQTGKAEWLEAASKMTEEEKQEHLDYCIAVTKSRYTASLEVMNEDFFRFVMDNRVLDTTE